jgi:hypothetical protein
MKGTVRVTGSDKLKRPAPVRWSDLVRHEKRHNSTVPTNHIMARTAAQVHNNAVRQNADISEPLRLRNEAGNNQRVIVNKTGPPPIFKSWLDDGRTKPTNSNVSSDTITVLMESVVCSCVVFIIASFRSRRTRVLTGAAQRSFGMQTERPSRVQ